MTKCIAEIMGQDHPWPAVGGQYGAPLGRPDTRPNLDGLTADELATCACYGEYDAGGAYWGLGAPVWAVWECTRPQDGILYVRADTRKAAIRLALGEDE